MKNDYKLNGVAAGAMLFMTVLLNSCGTEKTETTVAKEETVKEEKVQETVYDTNSPESMLKAVSEACGSFNALKALKDVSFDYHYVQPDGKKDVSNERYIFDKEISWAKYTQHEVNIPAELEGDVVQFFDGQNAKVLASGSELEDPKVVGTGRFLRQANYMWFTMMFKLTDPGVVSKYDGQEEMDGKKYDVVTVTYDPEVTGKEQNDIYILYINPETHMVENFKFSLPAFGIEVPVLLAKLTYTTIDGIKVVSNRKMFAPSPEGEGMVPMVEQILENVTFNNGFTAEQLRTEV